MAQNTYSGWTLTDINTPLKWLPTDFGANLRDDFVQVKVSHCGICYSDVAMIGNEWRMTKCPIICGHEVVGHVSAIGKLVNTLKVGDRVGCSNLSESCGTCEFCISGRDNVCPTVKWTVMRGGFGQYVRLHHTFVFTLPTGLSNEHAAPLMCAGATVFAPFKVNNVKPTNRVGIVGIGGLGHIALQIARAWGTEVTAISTSRDKEAESKKFGAHHFLCVADKEAVLKTHNHYFDFILVTATAPLDWGFHLSLLRNTGTICIAGLPGNSMNIPNLSDLVIRELKIVGAASASRGHYREMIDFCALHNIRPLIEVLPISSINEGIERVRNNKARYRVVVKHDD